jgi:hypothetical protein
VALTETGTTETSSVPLDVGEGSLMVVVVESLFSGRSVLLGVTGTSETGTSLSDGSRDKSGSEWVGLWVGIVMLVPIGPAGVGMSVGVFVPFGMTRVQDCLTVGREVQTLVVFTIGNGMGGRLAGTEGLGAAMVVFTFGHGVGGKLIGTEAFDDTLVAFTLDHDEGGTSADFEGSRIGVRVRGAEGEPGLRVTVKVLNCVAVE